MTKSLMILLSALALAACDTMPNRTASDSKSMPSTSRSDTSGATGAATAGAVPTGSGAAAAGRAGTLGSGSTNGDAGISAPGSTEVGPSGMAPK